MLILKKIINAYTISSTSSLNRLYLKKILNTNNVSLTPLLPTITYQLFAASTKPSEAHYAIVLLILINYYKLLRLIGLCYHVYCINVLYYSAFNNK